MTDIVTPVTPVIKPIVNAILIHKCCGKGQNLILDWSKTNPDKEIKVKSYSMFVARDNGMLTKYSIDISLIQAGMSYLLIDDKITLKG